MNLCRLDGLWLESNPAFLEIIGYPRAEADGGLTYWQLTPPDYEAEEAEQIAKANGGSVTCMSKADDDKDYSDEELVQILAILAEHKHAV